MVILCCRVTEGYGDKQEKQASSDKEESAPPLSDKKTAAEIAIYDGMTPEELLVRYRQLLEQNKRQRAQIELAETMIDVAEEEFGIAVRKKLVPSSSSS